METIEIDREVFACLQRHARAFVDTPNSTLRRLLGIDPPADSHSEDGELSLGEDATGRPVGNGERGAEPSKAPKADLSLLVDKGILQDGQKLYLIDYQGKRAHKVPANISGSGLIFEGRRFSMSALAQRLLSQRGFKSAFVRGPAHWTTEDGKTVRHLWQSYLEGQTTP